MERTYQDKSSVLEVLHLDHGFVEDEVVVLKLSAVVGGVHDLAPGLLLAQTAHVGLPV